MKRKIKGYIKKPTQKRDDVEEMSELLYKLNEIKDNEVKPDLANSIGSVVQLVTDLNEIKDEVTERIDSKLEEVNEQVESLKVVVDEIKEIKKGEDGYTPIKGVDYFDGLPGEKGKDINEDLVIKKLLAQIPKVDEKKLKKDILKAIPVTKADLKIIRESVEVDPMSVIDKIMALPEEKRNKLKFKTDNIDGLTQTIHAFQTQLGRGYLHGGGISNITGLVQAGLNVTITGSGTSTDPYIINSTGGGESSLVVDTTNIENGTDTRILYDNAGILGEYRITGTGTTVAMAADPTFSGLTIADGTNITLNTTTGTKIGTATNQKLGFYNATPIVQPTGDIATALQNLGLIASATYAVPSTITVANEATDTTCFVGFFTDATGNLQPKTNANFLINSNTGALGLGATPDTRLTVSAQTAIQTAVSGSVAHFTGLDANPLRITFDTHNNSSSSGSALMFRHSRGTGTTPSATQSGDVLASLNARGYGTSQYAAGSTGVLSWKANQTFTNTANGTYLSVSTTPDGSVTAAEVARFNGTDFTVGVAGTMLGTIKFSGSTSGTTSLIPNAVASGTLTLPSVTGTLVAVDRVVQGSPVTTTSTTYVDVTGMSRPLAANSTYTFQLIGEWSSNNNAAQGSIGISMPAGTTWTWSRFMGITSSALNSVMQNTTDQNNQANIGTSGAVRTVLGFGRLVTAGTSGNLQVRMASGSASHTMTAQNMILDVQLIQ